MIVSTKGRYALRVMIDLAEHRSEKYVPLKEVAARQEISEKTTSKTSSRFWCRTASSRACAARAAAIV